MRTAVITGANGGIGFQIARRLALQGWRVWLACRTEEKAHRAAREINRLREEADRPANAFALALDLSRFVSVRAAAKDLGAQIDRLDLLVCNAGLLSPDHQMTEDGFELQFQVNHLGHFLLQRELLPLLEASADPRVVNVTSELAERGRVADLAALQSIARVSKAKYDMLTAYRESKLVQLLMTVEAQRREGQGGIRFFAVHPGFVNTSIFYRGRHPIFPVILKPIAWLVSQFGGMRSPAQGAETPLFVATAESVPGGTYWADKKQRPMPGIARDRAYTAALWSWCLSAVGESM